jgi:hypothetical protein
MPSSNPDSLISFRDVALAEEYDRLVGRSSRHQAVKLDLKRYRHLIKVSAPNLNEDELRLITENLEAKDSFDSQKVTSEKLMPLNGRLAALVSNLSPAAWFAVVEKIALRESRRKKK